jgi:Uma2 family endonuclease
MGRAELMEVAEVQLPPYPEANGRDYELIDGQWVEKEMGVRASRIAALLIRLLDQHAEAQGAGLVFDSECGYRAFPHAPKLTRYPDVSFVRRGRLPAVLPEGAFDIAPDLAVEVISPNDLAEGIEERLMDFLRAGVPLVWVIYPTSRCARVLRAGGAARQLTGEDELQGEDVLPGFVCRLGALFGEA